MFLIKFGLKCLFNFPPHLTGVFSLPGETKKRNFDPYWCYERISVSVLNKKMCEEFGSATKCFLVFTTEPKFNTE